MANHNNPPRQNNQSETSRVRNEALLNNEQILSEPTGLDPIIKSNSDPSQRLLFEDSLGDAIAQMSDSSQIGESFDKLRLELLASDEAKAEAARTGIQPDLTNYPIGSYMALVIASNPHPEAFLSRMQENFHELNPSRTKGQEADFLSDLNKLAEAAYGDRYAEYQQQLSDLDLAGIESSDQERQAHEREVSAAILGGDHRVRLAIDKANRNVASAAQMFRARASNLKSAPANLFYKAAAGIAENRHNKKVLRFDEQQRELDLRQDMLDLSAGPKFIRNFRQQRLDKAQRKLEQKRFASESKAQSARDKYDLHSAMMDGRIEGAKRSQEWNNEQHEALKDNLRSKKEIALANRALRRDLRGLSFEDRRARLEAFKDLSANEIAALARAAHVESTAERAERTAQNRYNSTAQTINEHSRNITTTESAINNYQQAANSLQQKIQRYQEAILPRMEEKAKDAEKALKESDPSSPDYKTVQAQYDRSINLWTGSVNRLNKAQAALKKLEKQIASSNEQLIKSQQAKQDAETLALQREQELRVRQAANAKKAGAFHRTLDSTRVNRSQP